MWQMGHGVRQCTLPVVVASFMHLTQPPERLLLLSLDIQTWYGGYISTIRTFW
eukprot:m.128824 g.128824  ORF g.128824 m.128824 type:complete len:53 (+) comp17448_c1_seq3:1029-1187(+)